MKDTIKNAIGLSIMTFNKKAYVIRGSVVSGSKLSATELLLRQTKSFWFNLPT